jgi:iron complex transport system permease protein
VSEVSSPGIVQRLPVTRPAVVLLVLGVLAFVSVAAFLTLGARGSWDFVLSFRGPRLLALILVAYAIAVSTVLFQTVTNNRILTPSIMGFDALYVLVQTSVVLFLGTEMLGLANPYTRFFTEVALMTGFAWVLFRWLFLGEERSLHLLVLVGIVFGIFFRALSAFMQRVLDPNAFQVLQDALFASFQRIDTTLLGISILLVGAVTFVFWRVAHAFDVLTLGRAQAISLGVDYPRTVMLLLMGIAVLVAVSTALVGPITFLGLLVASLARALLGDSLHRHVLPATVLLGIATLVGGQAVLERVFSFDTALSIIVEFLGGLVFIILILRGAAR